MDWKELLRGFNFFWQGIKAAKREMWVSLEVLLALTVVISFFIQIVEHAAQPEVYAHWYDSVVWAVMSYLGNPGKFAPADPVTFVGRMLWIVISLIKLAIFAVPAGLVAKGFTEANAKDKREKQLADFRERMRKSFRTKKNRKLEEVLKSLPADERPFEHFHYVPDFIPVSDMQVLQNMDMRDIMDTVHGNEDFRLRNQANADVPGHLDDKMLVEHVFINTKYGCCIDRHSKVTIVSPKSREKMGIGWFTFHLAKMAGFNYISKDLEVDKDESDDYYDMTAEPVVDGKIKDLQTDKSKLALLERKADMRRHFIEDLKRLTAQDDSWVIFMLRHRKTGSDNVDIHLIDEVKDYAGVSAVRDHALYRKVCEALAESMQHHFRLLTQQNYKRFKLSQENLMLRSDVGEKHINAFTIRLSSHLINFNESQMTLMLQMAKSLAESLTGGMKMQESEKQDVSERQFGYNKNLYCIKK